MNKQINLAALHTQNSGMGPDVSMAEEQASDLVTEQPDAATFRAVRR